MEELQVKFVVTNRMVYTGVMKATDNITSTLEYKTGWTTINSIITDNFLNKELQKYVLRKNLHLKLMSRPTGPTPAIRLETPAPDSIRIVLGIPTRDNMYSNGLKKVSYMPSSVLIKGIFDENLYDRMDQTEVKDLVALILSQFNLCDTEIGAYPNVSMGFSVIISNFEYDDDVLPEEFPNNEYSL